MGWAKDAFCSFFKVEETSSHHQSWIVVAVPGSDCDVVTFVSQWQRVPLIFVMYLDCGSGEGDILYDLVHDFHWRLPEGLPFIASEVKTGRN